MEIENNQKISGGISTSQEFHLKQHPFPFSPSFFAPRPRNLQGALTSLGQRQKCWCTSAWRARRNNTCDFTAWLPEKELSWKAKYYDIKIYIYIYLYILFRHVCIISSCLYLFQILIHFGQPRLGWPLQPFLNRNLSGCVSLARLAVQFGGCFAGHWLQLVGEHLY